MKLFDMHLEFGQSNIRTRCDSDRSMESWPTGTRLSMRTASKGKSSAGQNRQNSSLIDWAKTCTTIITRFL